uniref:Uncharacterized protein n=1 Tax=Rhizophora mucronata TaxID=61149 RepID=A0A2P2QI97_RHIMU
MLLINSSLLIRLTTQSCILFSFFHIFSAIFPEIIKKKKLLMFTRIYMGKLG